MLQPVVPIKGIVGFMTVCTQPVSKASLRSNSLEHFSNFVRYFHEAIRCIEWVVVPQIDNKRDVAELLHEDAEERAYQREREQKKQQVHREKNHRSDNER